jgi:hypothetical protein
MRELLVHEWNRRKRHHDGNGAYHDLPLRNSRQFLQPFVAIKNIVKKKMAAGNANKSFSKKKFYTGTQP